MDADSAGGGSEQDNAQNSEPTRVQSCSSLKSKYSALSFKVNGQTVPLRPEGETQAHTLRGSTELRLSSSSGFTSIRILSDTPVAPPSATARSAHIISGGSSELRLSSSSGFTSFRVDDHTPVPPPSPAASSAPIISDVVSGEEAQKVLNGHMVSVEAPPPVSEHRTPHQDRVRRKMMGELRILGEGACSSAPPPACVTCSSPYRLITELRGFLCMCSPIICQSLIALKKKRKQKPSRQRKKDKTPSNRNTVLPALSVSNSQSSFSPSPENVRSRLPRLDHAYTSPKAPEVEPAEGKMVILLEDFYYGSAPGHLTNQSSLQMSTNFGPISCNICTQTLSNNIRLMQHMQLHVGEHVSRSDVTCRHCYRQFLTAAKLQNHMHEVHTCRDSTVTCRICELSFGSEPDLLCHMRTTHRPGEMPYTCQVCGFRSSSYRIVWTHFEQLHANTRNLLCQFCLRVMHSSTCYQQHVARHQKGCHLTCHRCRLHFLFVRDRLQHEAIHHRTHIKPSQLSGLKPGTKVTVRTYSVSTDSSKDADRPILLSNQRPPKRQKVGSLQHLSWPGSAPQHCIECQSPVADFSCHFPSEVHCWLCSFTTCCSNTYASHMINNHSHKLKSSTVYSTIFRAEPRMTHTVRCESCSLSTCRGDLMANHLAAWPEHTCTIIPPAGSCLCEDKSSSRSNTPLQDINSSVMSSGMGGAFVPVLFSTKSHSSSQLSINPLTPPLQSIPAMTITFLRPHPQPAQLELVLQALCHGVPQVAMRSQTSPRVIQSMIEQLDHDLSDHSWNWWAEPLAEWVLNRREQQLVVSEDVLLQTARTALRRALYGTDARDTPGEWTQAELRACYTWTVNFLLRHEVGLHKFTGIKLPQSVQERSHCFTQSLQAQMRAFSVPLSSVGFMDEFPLFLDVDLLRQDRLALQFCSLDQQRPLLDVVLSALSDGTLLPPMLFFTGAAPSLPKGFPDNVILLARPQGFTDHERLSFWIYKVWRPRMATLTRDRSLLLMDAYRGHGDVQVRRTMSCMSTIIQFIPPSCSGLIQPLDVCVTPVLREFLQSRWSRLVSSGGLEGLDLDQLVLMFCCWFSEVTSTLSAETHFLSRSFKAVCELQQLKEPHRTQQMIHELSQALDPGPGAGPGSVTGMAPKNKTKTGSVLENKPGTESGSELGLLPETEHGSEARTGPGCKLLSVPGARTGSKPSSLPGTEQTLKPETGSEPEPVTTLKPESGSVPGAQTGLKLVPLPETEHGSELGTGPETELGSVPRAKTECKPGSLPGAEPVPGTEIKPKPGSVQGTDADIKFEPGTELNLWSTPESGITTKPELIPEPETKIEPEKTPSFKPKIRPETRLDLQVHRHESGLTEARRNTLKDSELSRTRSGTRTRINTRSGSRKETRTRSGARSRTGLGTL